MSLRDADFELWVQGARDVPVSEIVARRGLKLRGHDAGQPCPGHHGACGGHDRFSVNITKNLWQCRAEGLGGDAIALVQHIEDCDFMVAVEIIANRPPPGRAAETDAQKAARQRHAQAEAERAQAQAAETAATAAKFRLAEKLRMYDLWNFAAPARGSMVEAYLELRGLHLPPDPCWLRFVRHRKLWDGPGGKVLHDGPAMIARIVGPDGHFAGVHCTWLDLAQAKGKALVADGDGELVAAKKVRGSQKGGSIVLARHWRAPTPGPLTWFLGEGIETVIAVYNSLCETLSPWLEASEFRSAVNLGNIGRRAAGSVPHPVRKLIDKNGRERLCKVPGPVPLPDDPWPMIPLPDGLQNLVLLGDGDGDAFRTRLALERGAASYAQKYPDVTIRLAMAGEGVDFNDLRRGRG